MESAAYAVLIDDRADLKENWERKGGVFVHHTTVQNTLEQLKVLGVL
jgi:hypothetical protein